MSPSPVRAMSAEDRTETTCGVRRTMLGVRDPVTTISPASGTAASAPGVETSTSSSGCPAASPIRVTAGVEIGGHAEVAVVPCASAAGVIKAEDRSSRLRQAKAVFMQCSRSRDGVKRGGPRRPVTRDQPLAGSAVQLPLAEPKFT